MTMDDESGSKKKSLFRKLLTMRESNGRKANKESSFDDPESEPQFDSELDSLFSCDTPTTMPDDQRIKPFRVFAGTWNVGGKPPHSGLNLDDFLQVHDESDIYILGFQEIVPLNAGNVLVIEDNEPAVNWLDLVNESLNQPNFCPLNPQACPSENKKVSKSSSNSGSSSSMFFQKPNLRKFSKKFRTESKRKLKTCNCCFEHERKSSKESCFRCQQTNINENDYSSEEDDGPIAVEDASTQSSAHQMMKYGLIVSKQMVGIFVTIWMRKELAQYVGHLRISCTSRGIMGCLGNKGCISVSMSFHQTSLCFVISHLASGEREGDELRRNYDVTEILKNTQFPKICKTPNTWVPDRILEHDRVIWLGDLNYRIALSYYETRKLLERNDWDTLLNKDQLKMERESGRVFKGWKEGKIYFAPTYKYSYNSDTYSGETIKSKDKRRTPAWCDRILWHGSGLRQLSYERGESRFSDHRPVCATFLVDVGIVEGGPKKAQ